MTHTHRRLQRGRETEILGLIARLPDDAVVVGGYAVNAYAPPRESVDLDVVVGDPAGMRGLLKESGYMKVSSKSFDNVYGGSIERHEKSLPAGPATVDLLVGSLQTRQTGAVWSYELIAKSSVERPAVCRLGTVLARVPFKELLLAMKVHAARFADARDVGMLCYGGIEAERAKGFAHRGDLELLESNIDRLIGYAGQKEYLDGIKSVYGMGTGFDVGTLSKRTVRALEELKKGLQY